MRIALALCTAALAAGCASTVPDTVALEEDPNAARASVCRTWWSCGDSSSRGDSMRDRIRAEDQRQANAQNPGPYPAVQPELELR